MYYFKFILLLSFLLLSCKNKEYSKAETVKQNLSNNYLEEVRFTYKSLIGKTFYNLNATSEEGQRYVQDKGAGVDKLVFKRGKLDNYRPIEWANYNITEVEEKDNYLILSLKFEAIDRIDKIKIEYNPEIGLLKKTDLTHNYEMEYIDSLKLFTKNSDYQYVLEKPEVKERNINLSYKDYKKNKFFVLGGKEVKSEDNWLEDKEVLKKASGDLNNDKIQDKVFCVVPKGKRDSESEVETLVLLGTIVPNEYRLHIKSKKIVPCHLCEFENFNFLESFYLTKTDNGVFTFSSSSEHLEYSFEYLDFVFEYNKKGDFILTKVTRSFEDIKDIESIDLPPFEITLKDFDVYYFIKKYLAGSY